MWGQLLSGWILKAKAHRYLSQLFFSTHTMRIYGCWCYKGTALFFHERNYKYVGPSTQQQSLSHWNNTFLGLLKQTANWRSLFVQYLYPWSPNYSCLLTLHVPRWVFRQSHYETVKFTRVFAEQKKTTFDCTRRPVLLVQQQLQGLEMMHDANIITCYFADLRLAGESWRFPRTRRTILSNSSTVGWIRSSKLTLWWCSARWM